jgi:hypothetical protein
VYFLVTQILSVLHLLGDSLMLQQLTFLKNSSGVAAVL